MQSLFSWSSIFNRFFDFQESNPLLLVNHLLQALFFSSALCHLCALALKLVHFSYAEQVAASRITQFVGLLLFYYLKIWDYYSGLLYFLSLFSVAVVSLYVYDCCGNISSHLDSWRDQHRDIAVIASATLMLSTTLYILWQIFGIEENAMQYSNSGIYCIILVLIVIGNYLRRRSILYTLMGVLTINYLIATRHLLHDQLEGNSMLRLARIPFETIVYFIMAIDAQKKERDAMKADKYKSVFLSCTYLAAYCLLNHWEFPFQLLFGGMNIIGLIIGK